MAVNYNKLAKEVVKYIGGKENIVSFTNCATRMRFILKDEKLAQKSKIEKVEGVKGVMIAGGQYQVVIGSKVSVVYEECVKILGEKSQEAEEKSEKKVEEKAVKGGNILDLAIRTVSTIFTPILLVLCGSGVLKGVLAILTACGVLAGDGTTYSILYAAADAIFVFLPFALAVTSARVFHANEFVAVAIAGAMIYPEIQTLYTSGAEVTFAGISVTLMDYKSSVLPVIFSVYALSKLEKLLKKIVPEFLYSFVMPFVCMAVMVPVSLIVIGPVLTFVSNALAEGYTAISSISPVIPGLVIGAFWQILVIFGIHWGFVPIMMNNISVTGADTMVPLIGPSNFGQAGAALGVFLKTKKNNVKTVSGSAALSGLFGITEPAIYGVTLKYKKPFYIASAAGAAGFIIAALAGANAPSVTIPGLLTLPAFIGRGFWGLTAGCAVAYISSAILTYLFGYNDSMEKQED